MRALSSSLITAVVLAACVASSNPPPGPPPLGPPQEPAPEPSGGAHHQPPGVAEVIDEQGAAFQIAQGEPGEPSVVGCADGQREAFVDAAAAPGVAGCIAEWSGTTSLRARPSGRACGDDLGGCDAPADACAPGWHLCGDDGGLAEVAAIGAEACEGAGGGRFVAAVSHCQTQDGCAYAAQVSSGRYECFEGGWCSEPVCCGTDCQFGACPGGVWAERTRIAIGTDQGCGAIGSSRARGVLCCRG